MTFSNILLPQVKHNIMRSNSNNVALTSDETDDLINTLEKINQLRNELPNVPSTNVILPPRSIHDIHTLSSAELNPTSEERAEMKRFRQGYPLLQRYLSSANNEHHAELLRLNHVFEMKYPDQKGHFSVTTTDEEQIHCNLCNKDIPSCTKTCIMMHHVGSCIHVHLDPTVCGQLT